MTKKEVPSPRRAIWLDVTDLSTVTFNSTTFAVSQVNDKSGNARHLTQATGTNQPILTMFGGANLLPYITLNSTKSLSFASMPIPQPFTIYLVCKQNAFTSLNYLLSFNGSNNNSVVQVTIASGPSAVGVAANVNFVGNPNFYKTSFALLKMVVNGANTTFEIMRQARANTSTSPGTTGTTSIKLGGSANFDFHELQICHGILSDAEDSAVRSPLMTKYGFSNNDSITYWGDSITIGMNATTEWLGFAYLTASEKGKDYVNYGVPSTRVYGSGSTSDFLNTVNYSQYSNSGWAVLSYGTNDIPASGDTVWKGAYKAMVKKLLTNGWTAAKIILMTPPYQSNKPNLVNVQTWTSQIATELGLTYVDMYAYTQANGGDTLLNDGTHPTTAGHRLMADYLKTFIS